MKTYSLDATHYISTPGYSYDCMLRLTRVELELVKDPDLYTFGEDFIRGGVSFISTRFTQANNEECPSYDPSSPKSYHIFLDANNLYGCSMSMPLPEKNYEFLNQDQINNLDLLSVPDDGPTGYIVEVLIRSNVLDIPTLTNHSLCLSALSFNLLIKCQPFVLV